MVQLLGRSLALTLQRQLLYSLRSAINRQGTYHRDNQELYSSSHFINTRPVRRESELPLLLGSKYTERQKDRQREIVTGCQKLNMFVVVERCITHRMS